MEKKGYKFNHALGIIMLTELGHFRCVLCHNVCQHVVTAQKTALL